MNQSTVGVSPKTIAAGVAALITPALAKALGLDEAILLGIVTALVTAAVAYFAPPGQVEDPELQGADQAVEVAHATDPQVPDVDDVDRQEELA